MKSRFLLFFVFYSGLLITQDCNILDSDLSEIEEEDRLINVLEEFAHEPDGRPRRMTEEQFESLIFPRLNLEENKSEVFSENSDSEKYSQYLNSGSSEKIFLNNKVNKNINRKDIQTSREISKKIKAAIYGFVETDSFFDTRQNFSTRDGLVLFYPLDKQIALNNKDINAHPHFNMSALQSIIGINFAGPKVGEAEVKAKIEGDFLGVDDLSVRVYKMRLAYINMDWKCSSLRIGQFYHSISPEDLYPDVVSNNGGFPIAPTARVPQVRYIQKIGDWELWLAASSQIASFDSYGPIGSTNFYLRNAIVPDLHLQVRKKINGHILAAAIDYLRLVPRLVSDKDYKVNESISGLTFTAYSILHFERVLISSQITYAQNRNDIGFLGGFAVTCIDPVTDARKYENINDLSIWVDIESTNKCFVPGLFVGFINKMGVSKPVALNPDGTPIAYVLPYALNINYVARCSPRIMFNEGAFRLAIETEFTTANYGRVTPKLKVIDGYPVTNFRLQMSAYYFF